MKKEEKELLLKDICARFPYGIKVQIKYYDDVWKLQAIYTDGTAFATRDIEYHIEIYLEDCKPYLFPLSSMTEEQEVEYDATFATIVYEDGRKDSVMTYKSFDWLNKNHIDYRGLIPMGLAIDATDKNIY